MNDLRTLLGSTEGVLLDFDGPVCKLFAGYPAAVIADWMRDYLSSANVILDDSIKGPDPLLLLRWASSHRPELLEPLERRVISGECLAAETATLTEHVEEVIDLVIESGRQVAIVSNNYRTAIDRFLELHHISGKVTSIVSRVIGHPELMKPSAEPVIKAAEYLDLPTKKCALIGDTVSDVTAARAAGSYCIGYAKNSARANELNAAGADAVIHSMGTVAAGLRDLLG